MKIIRLIALTLAACCGGVVPAGGPPAGPPAVTCRIWRNLPGAQVTDTLATNDLLRAPDEIRSIGGMEFAPDFTGAWACSLTALITPPTSGAYRFRIASRDTGLLFLSSDETAMHRQAIAETPAGTNIHDYKYYSAQTSDGIRLEAGRKYLIQAIVKSGPGPGVVSIGWQTPAGAFEGPIPPRYFAAASPDLSMPSLSVQQFNFSLKQSEAPTTQPALHAGINKFVRGVQFEVNHHASEMSYLMSVPNDYDTTTDTRPLLVFLHGNGRQGYTLEGTEQIGPVHRVEISDALRGWMPMLMLAPQLPPGWRWDTPGAAHAVNALVNQLCQRYSRIDPKRIYLTGLSMGGKGTWLTLENSPATYAAVVPISAVDIRPDLAPALLKDLHYLHIVCGSEDGGFTAGSHRMFEALKPAMGDRLEFTEFQHEGHRVWDHCYAEQSFYEKLLRFSK